MIRSLLVTLVLLNAASSFADGTCASTQFLIKSIIKGTIAISPTAKSNAKTSLGIVQQMLNTLNSTGLQGRAKSKERKRRLLNLNEMSKTALNANSDFFHQYVSSKDCDVVTRWKNDLNHIDDLINQDTNESRKELKEKLIETKQSIEEGVTT